MMNRMMAIALAGVAWIGPIASGEGVEPLRVHSGEFVKIYDPSVGESNSWYMNDHCFIEGTDGTWHMFGITHQEPAAPLNEIHLAHATAKSLLQQPWEKQPFALTAATGAPWHETHLWAPYVLKDGPLYYMFYCAGGDQPRRL